MSANANVVAIANRLISKSFDLESRYREALDNLEGRQKWELVTEVSRLVQGQMEKIAYAADVQKRIIDEWGNEDFEEMKADRGNLELDLTYSTILVPLSKVHKKSEKRKANAVGKLVEAWSNNWEEDLEAAKVLMKQRIQERLADKRTKKVPYLISRDVADRILTEKRRVRRRKTTDATAEGSDEQNPGSSIQITSSGNDVIAGNNTTGNKMNTTPKDNANKTSPASGSLSKSPAPELSSKSPTPHTSSKSSTLGSSSKSPTPYTSSKSPAPGSSSKSPAPESSSKSPTPHTSSKSSTPGSSSKSPTPYTSSKSPTLILRRKVHKNKEHNSLAEVVSWVDTCKQKRQINKELQVNEKLYQGRKFQIHILVINLDIDEAVEEMKRGLVEDEDKDDIIAVEQAIKGLINREGKPSIEIIKRRLQKLMDMIKAEIREVEDLDMGDFKDENMVQNEEDFKDM
ncbi:hypothetical protein BGX38DRAFT_1268730 [Terfezia claveryi]|nr:hypothetical protein BGX38DRAFT_1268730 [Terfezia claveryi]